jgi:hypothetical protein
MKKLSAANPNWHWLGAFPNTVSSAEMHKARVYTFVEVEFYFFILIQS